MEQISRVSGPKFCPKSSTKSGSMDNETAEQKVGPTDTVVPTIHEKITSTTPKTETVTEAPKNIATGDAAKKATIEAMQKQIQKMMADMRKMMGQ